MINLSVLPWPSVYMADVFGKIQLHFGSLFVNMKFGNILQ